MFGQVVICYLLVTRILAAAAGAFPENADPGRFRVETLSARSLSQLFQIGSCPVPQIQPSQTRPNIYNVKPCDIKCIASIGDSFTTGLFAKHGYFLNPSRWQEYPGCAFCTGGDPDAITLANYFKHYHHHKCDLIGASKGCRCLKNCIGFCDPEWIYIPDKDGLNAGISGGKCTELELQVNYLVERLDALLQDQHNEQNCGHVEKNDWKFVTIFIGINDICSSNCETADTVTQNMVGHPGYYKRKLLDALDQLHKAWPNTIVQLIQLFDISQYASAMEKYPQCNHIDWIWTDYVCPCAKTEKGRELVKKRITKYNLVLEQVWESYRDQEGRPKHSDFAVLLSPVLKDLNFTTDFHPSFASEMDCTHPSTLGIAHIATAIWNQLFKPSNSKHLYPLRLPMDLYCPTQDDTIQVL